MILKDKTIDYVFHIADLHIRNLKRHNEYRLVFNKFLQDLDNKPENSILYIGGDIAHAKTEMTPELVREVSWFLKECADRIPTLVIAGNHDCNLLNPSRLDVLSPIVDSLDHPNLFYLKDTGVYNVGNLTISVFSIFDNKENWIRGNDIEGEHKIVFFHGPVYSSKTDVGYTVSSKSFTADIFDGFHIGMLGDIHSRQIIQEYDEKNNKPILAYPSSLIQQNQGELLENHGYLLWDIKNRTFTEHNIYNEYGYLTLDIIDGKIPSWIYDEVGLKLPKRIRVRLKTQDTNNIQLQSCITELKGMFDEVEVSVTRMDTLNSLKSNSSIDSSLIGNVRDVVFQNKLIGDYLTDSYGLDQTTLDKIYDLNIQFNNKLNSNESYLDRIVWIPKTFEFSNMFSYGDGNKIRFDRASGLVGLFAPNAQGKSSVWDALSFCIFDKCSRAFKAQHIMNNQRDNFYCKFHFQINNTDYYVERYAKKTKTGVRVDVNFWREYDGNVESLNGEHRRDTNDKIEYYIGKYDDFILTTLSLQGNNSLFIDKSQSERKDILSQFIGIDVFDKLYDLVLDNNKKTNALLERYENIDYSDKIKDIDVELVDNKQLQTDLQTKLDTFKLERQVNIEQLADLNKQIVPLNVESFDIDNLLKDKQNKETESDNVKTKLDETELSIINFENLETELRLKKDTDYSTIEIEYNKLNELNALSASLHTELDKLVYKLNSNEDTMAHLNEHEYNPDCSICVKNSKSVIDKKETIQTTIEEIKAHIDIKMSELRPIEDSIDKLSYVKVTWNDYNDLLNELDTIKNNLIHLNQSKSELNLSLHTLRSTLERIERNIGNFYKNENTIKSNAIIETQIGEVTLKIKEQDKSIDKLQQEMLKAQTKNNELKAELKSIEKNILEYEELVQTAKLYEYYLDSISRNGVPYNLISKAIPIIEQEINNILTQIVDFTIELEMDGKTINAYIVYSDQKWPLEMSSGMERFVGGLAIRIALINLCNLPRPNFLIIDEGLGTLDGENLQSIFLMFSYLKTQFDFIILISHLDIARDFVDSIMEIRKKGEFSYINF